MDEIKQNLFMLSKEDIQEIISCVRNGDTITVNEITYISAKKPYLEIQKNSGAWRTYLFGDAETIEVI
jgi:hypothetical protein